jgi:hypothetical protein
MSHGTGECKTEHVEVALCLFLLWGIDFAPITFLYIDSFLLDMVYNKTLFKKFLTGIDML